MITRTEAIAQAGQILAASRREMAETYQRGGARAVAEAACPGGAPEEIERLAAKYETWMQE